MNKLLCLVLASSLAFPLNSYANCPKPVTLLEEGSPTPCKGFLFSPQEERKLYLLKEDYKLLQEEVVIKDKLILNLKRDLNDVEFIIIKEREKAELWRNAAETSSLKMIEATEGQGKRDIWMILLGVGLTVGAGYAIGQAAR